MDIDNIIKSIKEDRSHGRTGLSRKHCERCGFSFTVMSPSVSDETHNETILNEELPQPFCYQCLGEISMDKVSMFTSDFSFSKRRTCHYCFKVRTLVGAWCKTCRNNHQRREIKILLNEKFLTDYQRECLALYRQTPLWRKEFRKIKI